MKSLRLRKVAAELNLGIDTITEFLAKKGYTVEPNPSAKITKEQYDLIVPFCMGKWTKGTDAGTSIG